MAGHCRGGGMPRPYEFYTQNPAKRKPSPGGCAPRSESKIYMTAGGSHTSTTLAQRQLRLMRSKRSTITMGRYKIATFDLIRHAERRDTFPSRGRLWPVLRWQPLPPLIRLCSIYTPPLEGKVSGGGWFHLVP